MSLANAIMSTDEVSTDRFTIMPRPGPQVSNGVRMSRKFSLVRPTCMNRSWRSSSRWRSASSGAMTTNFERSKPMCRSMSGSVPRPIEPKPIITMGPSKVACNGKLSVVRVSAFMSATPEKSKGLRRARRWILVVAHQAGDEGRQVVFRVRRGRGPAGRADEPAGAVEGRRRGLAREQPLALIGAGQPQRAGLVGREAEPAVVGSIAHQQHRHVTGIAGGLHCVLDQRCADTAVALV